MVRDALFGAALLQLAGISAAQVSAPPGAHPVRYACGGIGDGEQQAIRKAAFGHGGQVQRRTIPVGGRTARAVFWPVS